MTRQIPLASASSQQMLTWGKMLITISLLCVVSTLPYLSTLHSYFLSDDFGVVQLLSAKAPLHALSLFTRPWTEAIYGDDVDELRPTVAVAFQLGSLWGSSSPTLYHCISIAVHTINVFLVLLIARYIARLPLVAAVLSAALFAVLPIHGETLGWLQGLSDSVPTMFYLATFLSYAIWRRAKRVWFYCASCLLFFLTLYSKQSAITMLFTLIGYDFLVERRQVQMSWSYTRAYAVYFALTVAYLIQRYVLFGQMIRENYIQGVDTLKWLIPWVGLIQVSAAQMLVLGTPWLTEDQVRDFGGRTAYLLWSMLGLSALLMAAISILACVWKSRRPNADAACRLIAFFGPLWWIISTIPLVVTYQSPRHLYLASTGLAVALGLCFDRLMKTKGLLPSRRRRVVLGCWILLILASAFMVQRPLSEWNRAAAISETILRDVQREVQAGSEGSLVILGAPNLAASSAGWNDHILLWYYALPFALQPPFTRQNILEQESIIYPLELYCCQHDQRSRQRWLMSTRDTLQAWLWRPEQGNVKVLTWDPFTGEIYTRSEEQERELRGLVKDLLDTSTVEDMQRKLRATIIGVQRTNEERVN
jgi:hypothetical protein